MNKNERNQKDLLVDAKADYGKIKAEGLAIMNEAEETINRAFENYEARVREINRIFKV